MDSPVVFERMEQRLLLSASAAPTEAQTVGACLAESENVEFPRVQQTTDPTVDVVWDELIDHATRTQFERLGRDFVMMEEIVGPELTGLSEHGMETIQMAKAWMFCPPDENGEFWEPDEEMTRRRARMLDSDRLVCINIEHWPMDRTEAEYQETVRKLSTIVDWLHDENPDLKVGLYRFLPKREYWWPQDPEYWSEEYAAWQETNAKRKELADKMDVIFPSLYTLYDKPHMWAKYAEANIAEAKKYGKPVVAFLMPYYHGGSSDIALRGQPIDGAFWSQQLQTVRESCDGAVLWAHFPWGVNESQQWWGETRDFLKQNRAVLDVVSMPPLPLSGESGAADQLGTPGEGEPADANSLTGTEHGWWGQSDSSLIDSAGADLLAGLEPGAFAGAEATLPGTLDAPAGGDEACLLTDAMAEASGMEPIAAAALADAWMLGNDSGVSSGSLGQASAEPGSSRAARRAALAEDTGMLDLLQPGPLSAGGLTIAPGGAGTA